SKADGADAAEQVGKGGIGAGLLARFGASDEVAAADAGRATGGDVARLVSHQQRTRQVDDQLVSGPTQQSGRRLATVTGEPVTRDAGFRMVRTVVDRVEVDTLAREQVPHVVT